MGQVVTLNSLENMKESEVRSQTSKNPAVI